MYTRLPTVLTKFIILSLTTVIFVSINKSFIFFILTFSLPSFVFFVIYFNRIIASNQFLRIDAPLIQSDEGVVKVFIKSRKLFTFKMIYSSLLKKRIGMVFFLYLFKVITSSIVGLPWRLISFLALNAKSPHITIVDLWLRETERDFKVWENRSIFKVNGEIYKNGKMHILLNDLKLLNIHPQKVFIADFREFSLWLDKHPKTNETIPFVMSYYSKDGIQTPPHFGMAQTTSFIIDGGIHSTSNIHFSKIVRESEGKILKNLEGQRIMNGISSLTLKNAVAPGTIFSPQKKLVARFPLKEKAVKRLEVTNVLMEEEKKGPIGGIEISQDQKDFYDECAHRLETLFLRHYPDVSYLSKSSFIQKALSLKYLGVFPASNSDFIYELQDNLSE